jgi:hypothetical protein
MAAPDLEHELAEYTAALCVLLTERDGSVAETHQVREAAARARALLAPDADREELLEAFRTLDEALRRAGDARGLRGSSRNVPAPGATLPGVRRVIKVARCPGAVLCTRREPAPDLRLPPKCAVNGVRMRREQLRREP